MAINPSGGCLSSSESARTFPTTSRPARGWGGGRARLEGGGGAGSETEAGGGTSGSDRNRRSLFFPPKGKKRGWATRAGWATGRARHARFWARLFPDEEGTHLDATPHQRRPSTTPETASLSLRRRMTMTSCRRGSPPRAPEILDADSFTLPFAVSPPARSPAPPRGVAGAPRGAPSPRRAARALPGARPPSPRARARRPDRPRSRTANGPRRRAGAGRNGAGRGGGRARGTD